MLPRRWWPRRESNYRRKGDVMPPKNQIVGHYARMWPRDIFYRRVEPDRTKNPSAQTKTKRRTARLLFRTIELLKKPGVYVLYRGDVPYYVGQATKLRTRLWGHACRPGARYFDHWNFFSAFVIEDPRHRNQIESILIAAMPTANSMKPLKKEPLPQPVTKMIREMQDIRANPRPMLGTL
jgi:hypothetical protein